MCVHVWVGGRPAGMSMVNEKERRSNIQYLPNHKEEVVLRDINMRVLVDTHNHTNMYTYTPKYQ